MCDQTYGFSKIYDETRHLLLFGTEICNAIYDRIKYLLSKKSCVAYGINYSFARMRID